MTAKQLLIVDDNKDAADTLATVLRLNGYQVQVAYSAESSLQVAREQKPQVILLDIGMPIMDGYKVCRCLRDEPGTKDALIVAVTGHGLPADVERCKVAGFDLHLLKPVEHSKLLEAIHAKEP